MSVEIRTNISAPAGSSVNLHATVSTGDCLSMNGCYRGDVRLADSFFHFYLDSLLSITCRDDRRCDPSAGERNCNWCSNITRLSKPEGLWFVVTTVNGVQLSGLIERLEMPEEEVESLEMLAASASSMTDGSHNNAISSTSFLDDILTLLYNLYNLVFNSGWTPIIDVTQFILNMLNPFQWASQVRQPSEVSEAENVIPFSSLFLFA